MSTAVVLNRWRLRAGVGAAGILGVLAIAGGMSAGLESSSHWSNEASAAVIPEVLYVEDVEDVKIASIARVNGDIAREVTVDVRIDDLARKASTPTPAADRPAPTVMDDAPKVTPGDDRGPESRDDSADRATEPAATAGDGRPEGDAPTQPPTAPSSPKSEPPAPATKEPTSPAVDAPTPAAPEPAIGTTGKGTPQNDKPKPDTGAGDKTKGQTVDATSTATATSPRPEVTP